jgi:hypothetical protein
MSDIHFWSQAGQDKYVYENLPSPGTFLDIGCNDPYSGNNSCTLEGQGWRGLLVDLDAGMVAYCNRERKNPAVQMDAVTADWKKICEEHNLGPTIDYLSLDVDGPELAVLENLITAGLSFKIITCEHDRYHRGDEPRDAIRKFLLEQGYTLAVPDVKVFDEHYPEGVEYEDWWTKQ